ncbi:MAG: polymorphic toxin-type HINT domain-containing protein [Betaproteobacteria bacterium]|nr:polymorphic toxin-type HINT domain-containing protein [Betaproteobacteria bacterium]
MRPVSNEMNGTVMLKQVITDVETQAGKTRAQIDVAGCFIAGTLVHTREGLVPIEQIKVGDWVLSKPESGEGEQTYKRVTKMFRHEDREVWLLPIASAKEITAARAEKRKINDSDYSCVIGTPNHPIWVKGKGWVHLKNLWFGDDMEFANGELAVMGGVHRLYRTHIEGVATLNPLIDAWHHYSTFDLRDRQAVECYPWWKEEPPISKPYFGGENGGHPDLFRTTVYNLEVEDCHSYYVGTRGIWVHEWQPVVGKPVTTASSVQSFSS